mgnify:FL=1|jgi:hypothetical protein
MDQKKIKADKKKYKTKKANLKTRNKLFAKLKELGYPQQTDRAAMECLFKLTSIKYMKAKESEVVDCYTQINEYLETIDSQRRSIAHLENTIEHLQDTVLGYENSQSIYYKRICEWKDLSDKIAKENKEVWKQRNDAIRSYNGLIEMGKSARELGIDTKDWKLPEEEKDKFKDYKFSIDHKVLESGKVQYAAKLTKRKTNDE